MCKMILTLTYFFFQAEELVSASLAYMVESASQSGRGSSTTTFQQAKKMIDVLRTKVAAFAFYL